MNGSQFSPLVLGLDHDVLVQLGRVVPREVLVHAVELQLAEGGPVVAVGLQSVVDGLTQGVRLGTGEGPAGTCERVGGGEADS